MARALVCTMVPCDMCDETVMGATYFVHGTPDRFCSLVCCKIFYSQPNTWISKHRKETANAIHRSAV
jgi:hypothetical protein